jgi:hypothetical protein
MMLAPRTVIRRTAVAGQFVLIGLCLAWAVLERPAPLVNVRWREGLSATARRDAETRLYLEKGEPVGEAWRYELASPRRTELAAIVAHPDVRDTHRIDQRTATITADAGRGTLRVWWAGPFKGVEGRRDFRVVLATIGAITLLTALVADPSRRSLIKRVLRQ